MTETIGKREDAAAFQKAWARFQRSKHGRHIDSRQFSDSRELARHFFDAGMERGISKRGCCAERGEHEETA